MIIGEKCDRRSQLSKLSIPTLIIHGKDDPLVNPESGREVAASIPGSKLVMIDGMGHDLPAALIPEICKHILEITRSQLYNSTSR